MHLILSAGLCCYHRLCEKIGDTDVRIAAASGVSPIFLTALLGYRIGTYIAHLNPLPASAISRREYGIADIQVERSRAFLLHVELAKVFNQFRGGFPYFIFHTLWITETE